MLNKLLISVALSIGAINCTFSQAKFGSEWFLGITGQVLRFDAQTPYSKLLIELNTDTILLVVGNSNICDTNGHLILATDGIKLYDSMGKFIDGGGENINNDSIVWGDGYDTAYPNTSLILPKNKNKFYVFTSTMSDSKYNKYYNQGDTFDFDQIRYSIVDMNANGGKGSITVKNKLLLQVDEYPWINKSNFTACRHGNGRDWWLLKPSARMRQVMYKFLVTPDTILTFKEQLPLLFNTWAYDNVGQSAFSMDGSLYAECNNNGPHTIYRFDRCSGELSLKRIIDVYPFKDTFGTSIDNGNKWRGLCFSPNNRFLYTCDAFNIYQIDLEENNDTLAVKRVSKDTNSNPLPYGFPQYSCMQLTPTGQIYVGNWHAISPRINGIMYPDKLGDSSGFMFDYFVANLSDSLQISNTCDPPNMPFYGLGKLSGSPCDTIKPPVMQPVYTNIKVYPNPVHDNLTIELPDNCKKYELVVFNLLGQVVFRKKEEQVLQHKIILPAAHLAAGVYSIKIVTDQERFIGKFVKD